MLKQQSNTTKPIVIVRDVSVVTSGGVTLVPSIFLSIHSEKIGLVGANGVGKSTLLRIIAGVVFPSSGSVDRFGTVAYLPQSGFGDEISVQTLIQNRVNPKDEGLMRSFLGRFGLGSINMLQAVSTFSGGEQMKIFLSVLLSRGPDLLILDEPTNNLDRSGRGFLYSFVQGYKKGILVVSHDRELLQNVDHIIELQPTGITEYGGNYDFYVEQKAVQQQALDRSISSARQELTRNVHTQRSILEKRQQMKNKSRARSYDTGMSKQMRGHRQRKAEESTGKLKDVHGDRVESSKTRVEELLLSVQKKNVIKLDLEHTHVPRGKMMIEMVDVDFTYSSDTKNIISDMNLSVYGPEKIAVEGNNGSGKTTLVRLITGEITPTSGLISVGANRVSYLDQHTQIIDPNLSLVQNFEKLHKGFSRSRIREYLGRFLFTESDVFKKGSELSGGERIKAALALILGGVNQPHVLMLDEPTNNLDIDSIEQLESALQNYKGCLLVISHDAAFLESIGIERRIQLSS
ncbi:hypothetical protein COY32_07235 [candidate division WWE3 bacterium CG_4_10_14_0_2_um_filter_41_14]|uniref:ABC transporter domain-containing protein n=1 Tax=candidate division WWE3 bacterium CG_4_10_14_0_2_um_filter_41_14 TaxID=1975072 RepID=A0A2M7TEJ4_UNCKA|nr:MAG: hypothetical protein COY32_07235 [candidate division WWE3 bacterium CG_4_10_14_0_2_um_filter_41_14]